MATPLRPATSRLVLMASLLLAASAPAWAAPSPDAAAPDASGQARRGQASIFAPGLAGRRMADGGRFEPASDTAASTSLPLGSTARVRNLRNGRIAIVRVRDRLPESGERIVSVSPKVAQFLGMTPGGVAQVEVAPLAVPQRDGSIRLGSGTRLSGRRAYVTDPPEQTPAR